MHQDPSERSTLHTRPDDSLATTSPTASKRAWVPPRVDELPPLRDMTLLTGSAIPGGQAIFP